MENNTMTSKKVLIVDDEEDFSIYLSRVFEEAGFHATRAASGEEALQAAERERPDLITMDLSMPRVSGVRSYQTLRSRPDLATIPVIFVTGITGPGGPRDTERFYRTRRQMPPPDGFVAKPINPEKVLDLARKLTSVPRQAG